MSSRFVSSLCSCSPGVAAVLLIAACESALGPQRLPDTVDVRTTSASFPVDSVGATRRAVVTGTVVNNSDRALVLGYCGHSIAKQVGGEWVDVFTQNCAAIDGVDTPVVPGETATFVVSVENILGASPTFDFSPGAQYRVRLRMVMKAPVPYGDRLFEIEPDDRLSNPFTFSSL